VHSEAHHHCVHQHRITSITSTISTTTISSSGGGGSGSYSVFALRCTQYNDDITRSQRLKSAGHEMPVQQVSRH